MEAEKPTSESTSPKASPHLRSGSPQASLPPDSGLKAWSAVLGGWCCLFCSYGWINCIGIFQNQYQEHQLSEYAPSTVAWISSIEVRMTNESNLSNDANAATTDV
jgi:hypothetical protein